MKILATIGGKLKKARESKQITLIELQETTKIQLRYLEAIEEDDFASLPGEYNTKAFLRQYARAVGLDPDQIISEYMGAPVREEDLSQYKEVTRGSRKQQHHERSMLDQITRSLPMILLVIMFCLIVGGVLFAYFQKHDRYNVINIDDNYTVEGSVDSTTASSTQVIESSSTEESDTTEKLTTSIDSTSGRYVYMTVEEATDPLTISLASLNDGRCWVGITVDGTSVYNNTIEADATDEITLPAGASVVEVVFGAAQYIEMDLNGQPVEFEEEGVELLQATITMQVSYVD